MSKKKIYVILILSLAALFLVMNGLSIYHILKYGMIDPHEKSPVKTVKRNGKKIPIPGSLYTRLYIIYIVTRGANMALIPALAYVILRFLFFLMLRPFKKKQPIADRE